MWGVWGLGFGVYGDLSILIYPKPHSIYLRGAIKPKAYAEISAWRSPHVHDSLQPLPAWGKPPAELPGSGSRTTSYPYFKGRGDLVDMLVTPIGHVITPVIPNFNPLLKSP